MCSMQLYWPCGFKQHHQKKGIRHNFCKKQSFLLAACTLYTMFHDFAWCSPNCRPVSLPGLPKRPTQDERTGNVWLIEIGPVQVSCCAPNNLLVLSCFPGTSSSLVSWATTFSFWDQLCATVAEVSDSYISNCRFCLPVETDLLDLCVCAALGCDCGWHEVSKL